MIGIVNDFNDFGDLIFIKWFSLSKYLFNKIYRKWAFALDVERLKCLQQFFFRGRFIPKIVIIINTKEDLFRGLLRNNVIRRLCPIVDLSAASRVYRETEYEQVILLTIKNIFTIPVFVIKYDIDLTEYYRIFIIRFLPFDYIVSF